MLPAAGCPKNDGKEPRSVPTPWSVECREFAQFTVAMIVAGTVSTVVLTLALIGFLDLLMTRIIPSYPEFEINSLSVTDLLYIPNQISGHWNMDFNLKNFNTHPNMTFYFSSVKLSILYNNQTLWLTTLGDFDLGPKNVTARLGAKLWGSSGFVEDSTSDAIRADIKTNRTVNFDVKIEAALKKKNWWYSWAESSIVYCKDVELSFISPYTKRGKMLSGVKECEVQFIRFNDFIIRLTQTSSNLSHANM